MNKLTTDEIYFRLQSITGEKPKYKTCFNSVKNYIRNAYFEGAKIRGSVLQMNLLGAGMIMEEQVNIVAATNDLLKEAIKDTEALFNQLSSLKDITFPVLLKQVQQVREIRMSIVSEMTASINAMREVRTFFLEKDYEREMERMERFVRLCNDIKRLKEDGTFDAICDSAIRLAVKEEAK